MSICNSSIVRYFAFLLIRENLLLIKSIAEAKFIAVKNQHRVRNVKKLNKKIRLSDVFSDNEL